MKFLHAVSLPLLALAGLTFSCGDAPAPAPTESSDGAQDARLSFRPEDPPNILIFLIDTQRADYMSVYGHAKPTTPHLEAFAEESLVFNRAYAPASSTSPSHASLFTSTYPRVHGVWNRVPRGDEDPIFPALTPRATTLAEVLGEIGYDTAAICDGGNLQSSRGFDQGFRVWDSKYLGVDNRVDRALRWLDVERKKDRPFFLFLHTYQVHTPYLPKAEHVELFADPEYQGPVRKAWEDAVAFYTSNPGIKGAIRKIQGDFYRPTLPEEGTDPEADDLAFMKALYEANIHQVDAAFERLLNELEKREINQDNTLILVTSDHGEEFWEHGQYGHHQMYDSVAHIPFLVRGPGVAAGLRRDDPVDLLDVMPTLLHWSGLDHEVFPPSMMGRILDFTTDAAPAPYPIIGESNWPEHQLTWRDQDRKAMYFPGSDRATEVYRYVEDPAESEDRADREASWLADVDPQRSAWETESTAWQEEYNLNPGVRDWKSLSASEQRILIEMGYVGEGELEVKEEKDDPEQGK